MVEWFFRFEFNGEENVSNGASIIEFDPNGKIVIMKEFQSKHDHYYPDKN